MRMPVWLCAMRLGADGRRAAGACFEFQVPALVCACIGVTQVPASESGSGPSAGSRVSRSDLLP